MKQEIHRPILQTVKEFIHPYRNIVQTLRPVREDIRTIVPKDSDIGHNHMTGSSSSSVSTGSSGKTNDWSPVGGTKRSNGNIRQSSRLSPSQQLQQNRYISSRPISQMSEGVKTSESRPRLQRRSHQSFLDKPTRMAGAHLYNQYSTGLEKNISPMQFGSSEQEVLYLPMYDHQNDQHTDQHSLEEDFSDTESNISSYIDQLKSEENPPDELTVVQGSIGETLSRSKRHKNNNMVQCNEMGCEVSGSEAHSSWTDNIDEDYDRHYF